MLERIREFVRALFRRRVPPQPAEVDRYAEQYEDISTGGISAVIANKLGMLTFGDSTCTIDDQGGERGALIKELLERVWADGPSIAAQTFGKGGKVFVPYVHDGHIDVQAIDQNRMLVARMGGDRIVEATLVIDRYVTADQAYLLLADYSVGQDGVQTIQYAACEPGGRRVALDINPAWASLPEQITIGGTDRALIGFLRCPRDNRRDTHIHGVPITYGVEADIAELVEHMRWYRREYKLGRMMLGMDAQLWRKPVARSASGDAARDPYGGVTIEGLRKTVQDGDDPFVPVDTMVLGGQTPWQTYAPQIRADAMELRYNTLLRRVEKGCGLSQGILTERQQLNYANRDEVRAAQYDTFATIRAMRDAWEDAASDLAYAIDVLAEAFGLTPAGARGQYEIEYDWDTSLIESSTEAWAQLTELQSLGGASKAELRQWVRGGTIEEAEADIQRISEERAQDAQLAVDRMMAQGAADPGAAEE